MVMSFWSGVTIKIDLFYNDIYITSATGFFIKKNKKLFLISNWHVFSGRNTYSGQPIHGGIPNKFLIHFNSRIYSDNFLKKDAVSQLMAELPIYNKEEIPLWLMHPKGQDIDIAAIEINFDALDIPHFDINNNFNFINERVGDDVFILGFPKGIAVHGNYIPIWKKGSIASEPSINYQDLPVFLIDASTRDGMSGAPVIIEKAGAFANQNGMLFPEGGGPVSKLLGIYSGRITAKNAARPPSVEAEEQLQLGKVWKLSAILDVLENGIPGDYQLRKT